MKKLAVILGALIISATAVAQKTDSRLFNHLGIGVTAGIDGIGGQLAVTMGNHFQLRGGYSFNEISTSKAPFFAKKPFEEYVAPYLRFPADRLPSNIRESFKVPEGSTVDLAGSMKLGQFNLLLDFYPFTSGSFRITAGTFIGGSHLIDVTAGPLPCDPAEYNNAYIKLGDSRVGTDKDGVLKFDVRRPSVKPYLGLGFGRGVPKGIVSFGFDLGVMYNTSDFKMYTYDLDGKDVLLTTDIIVHDLAALTDEQIADNQQYIDLLEKALGWRWFPMMRFSLNFKLF